jgi:formylglycine-generating enzyme required for sulfatase activity
LHLLCRIEKNAVIKPFAIDKTPVTNLEFRRFLTTSGNKPRISENFLKHWINGQIPSGKMLLIWPGLDRCATVGFRCAVDL